MALRKEKVKSTRLDKIRAHLLMRRDALVRDLRQVNSNFIDHEEFYTDTVDQASADIDRSFTLQLKNRERDTLLQIDEALQRIDRGSFGVCERCDELISEARMKAHPATTLCIDCKAELESEIQRFSSRARMSS